MSARAPLDRDPSLDRDALFDRDASRYLDAAATAPLLPEARDAMTAALTGGQANPSSVHTPGLRAKRILEDARSDIAEALGARPSEVIFTSGGTEANNLAIIGLALGAPRGRHIITTATEHPSVLESCRYLERALGFDLSVLPVNATGRVAPDALAAEMRPDTTLVSIGLANGEIGTVQSIAELAEVARRHGALVHTDAVQAAPSLPLSFRQSDSLPDSDSRQQSDSFQDSDGADTLAAWPGAHVDAVTIASHKFGGPQGAGALLVRGHLPLEPILHGGGQEGGARSGTQNVAAIAGFAAAVAARAANVGSRALELIDSRDALIERVTAQIPGAALTGHATERLPGHASFVIAGVSGESLLVALDTAGYAVSSGSACAAGKDAPSPVLLAIGLAPELAQTAIRFTLPAAIPSDAVERITQILADTVARTV